MTIHRANMKSIAFITVFLILCANPSLQTPAFRNCTSDFVLEYSTADTCEIITCEGPGSFSGLTCAEYSCGPNGNLGFKASDNSKPYPECCGGPICG